MIHDINPDLPRLNEEVAHLVEESATLMGIHDLRDGSTVSELEQRVLHFRTPHDQVSWKVLVDDQNFEGSRTIHNIRFDEAGNQLPSRGGFRVTWLGNPNVYGPDGTNPQELSAFLAGEMAFKLLPYFSGGAKSVVESQSENPANDDAFLEAICRGTVRQLFLAGHYRKYRTLRDGAFMPTDIWAPDINTGRANNHKVPSYFIDAMVDELSILTGDERFARTAFTGKSAERGGHPDRAQATGRVAAYTLARTVSLHPELARRFGNNEVLRVTQQSLGQVGWHLQDTLGDYAMHHVIVPAVSEFDGTLIDLTGDGLPIHAIKRAHIDRENRKPLKEWQEKGRIAWTADPQEVLTVPTDVLSLAFDKSQVTKKNADDIQAAYIHPSSNGGVDHAAIPILAKRDIVTGADFVINGGGTRGSEMETEGSWSGTVIPSKEFRQQLETSAERALQGTFGAVERWSDHEEPRNPLSHNLALAAATAALEYLINDPPAPAPQQNR